MAHSEQGEWPCGSESGYLRDWKEGLVGRGPHPAVRPCFPSGCGVCSSEALSACLPSARVHRAGRGQRPGGGAGGQPACGGGPSRPCDLVSHVMNFVTSSVFFPKAVGETFERF